MLGGMFTQKLEQMFSDVDVSKGLTQQYRKYSKQDSADMSVSFNIISSSWPMTTVNNGNDGLVVPGDMSAVLDEFRDFYASVQPKRKLVWIHALSTCVVRASFEKVLGF